jgi:hypothetical protein
LSLTVCSYLGYRWWKNRCPNQPVLDVPQPKGSRKKIDLPEGASF